MMQTWRFKDVTRAELECGICKQNEPKHIDFCWDIPRGSEHSENLDYLNNLYVWKCHTVLLCVFCSELDLEDQYFVHRTGCEPDALWGINLAQKRKLWEEYSLDLPNSFIKVENHQSN